MCYELQPTGSSALASVSFHCEPSLTQSSLTQATLMQAVCTCCIASAPLRRARDCTQARRKHLRMSFGPIGERRARTRCFKRAILESARLPRRHRACMACSAPLSLIQRGRKWTEEAESGAVEARAGGLSLPGPGCHVHLSDWRHNSKHC